ncbi:hypothetical protein, variant [Allomyces macrogynus ATCC 38327]|uniref:Uncharacterized protein n=1 Tax=Allomyces macrogynus (strain ATCC 38327) TaxID=578462 RepID=A0A0L0SMF1_ALLM3|nr:hypothetical protein, variant [Allomyces macrogynus ATCC 38327]|eukprot:KNE63667.1 hypothetical protein, variant [Allomyces macrogynus ATCC 38327]
MEKKRRNEEYIVPAFEQPDHPLNVHHDPGRQLDLPQVNTNKHIGCARCGVSHDLTLHACLAASRATSYRRVHRGARHGPAPRRTHRHVWHDPCARARCRGRVRSDGPPAAIAQRSAGPPEFGLPCTGRPCLSS